MQRLCVAVVSSVLGLSLPGCLAGGQLGGDPGPSETADRSVAAFTRVDSSGSVDVEITSGSDTRVRVEAPERALEDIETVVEGDTLMIRMRDHVGIRFVRGRTIVHVSTPTLQSARTHGSGDLDITGVQADVFEVSTSGSGDVRVKGTTGSFKVTTTGSGDVDAEQFEAKAVSVSTTGSGDAHVRATEHVTGSSSGSGDVRVSGGASCEVSRSGSGDLHC